MQTLTFCGVAVSMVTWHLRHHHVGWEPRDSIRWSQPFWAIFSRLVLFFSCWFSDDWTSHQHFHFYLVVYNKCFLIWWGKRHETWLHAHIQVIKMCSDMELNIFKFYICNYATLNTALNVVMHSTPCFHKQSEVLFFSLSALWTRRCPRDFTLVCQAEAIFLKAAQIGSVGVNRLGNTQRDVKTPRQMLDGWGRRFRTGEITAARMEKLKGIGIKTALRLKLQETFFHLSIESPGNHSLHFLNCWRSLFTFWFFCFAASSAFRQRSAKLQLADAPESPTSTPPHLPPGNDWQLQLAKEALKDASNSGE